MPRAPRVQFEGAVYHVMARGNRREPIVFEDSDRKLFDIIKRHAYSKKNPTSLIRNTWSKYLNFRSVSAKSGNWSSSLFRNDCHGTLKRQLISTKMFWDFIRSAEAFGFTRESVQRSVVRPRAEDALEELEALRQDSADQQND